MQARFRLAAVWSLIAFAGCAAPLATDGLLEGELPVQTLAPPGEIGLSSLRSAIRQFALPSGMRLTVERAPTRGMVGVILTLGSGSTSDPPGREGLAHLVEHLVYRARLGGKADAPSVNEALVALGATYNGMTSLDTTRYYELAPMSELPQLLRMAVARLSDPLAGVSSEDLDLERTVVRNELRERNETGVYGQVLAWLQQELMPHDHPYARPLGGTHESLTRATLDDARAFARAHYRADNASLVLVGEFKGEDLRRLVEQDLPSALRGDSAHQQQRAQATVTRLPANPPPSASAGVRFERAAVPAPEVWVGWFLPSAYSAQQGPIVRLVTAPVLAVELRRRLSLKEVSVVDVVPLYDRLVTFVACQAVLEPGADRRKVAQEITDALAEMWRPLDVGGIKAALKKVDSDVTPEVELIRNRLLTLVAGAKNEAILGMRQQALAQVVFGGESFVARALAHADHQHFVGSSAAYEETLSGAAAATTDQVAHFAERFFSADRARTVFIDPVPADQRPAPSAVGVAGTQKEIGDTPVEAARFDKPRFMPPPQELAQHRRVRLPNGLDVILLRRPHFQTVTVALGFRGGSASGSPPGVVELLRFLEPAELVAIPLNAISAETLTLPDLTADVVSTGSSNVGNALMLLAMRLKATDGNDWDQVLAHDEGTKSSSSKPSTPSPHEQAATQLMRALYGDHPYGRTVDLKEVLAISPDQVRRWLPRMRGPGNALLVIAGDVELARGEELARLWFGSWRSHADIPAPALPPVPVARPGAPRETVLVTHRPGVSQTEVRVACRLPGEGARAPVANRLLAGMLGSYLYTRFRAETGAAYGVSGGARVLAGGAAHMVLETTVDDLRLADVLRSIRGHWRKFAEGQFDESALSQVRWRHAMGENLAFQTSAEVAVEVLTTLGRGYPMEHILSASDAAAAASTADLARAFETCRASTVLSLLGDQGTIRKALAAADAPAAKPDKAKR